MTWKIGEVVKLKSGGPTMTVVKVLWFGRVRCARFDLYKHGYDLETWVFPAAALTSVL